jgi:predicted nucleotidyltransferase component of viral defense system
MSRIDPSAIRFHEDVALFRAAISFTAAQTGFTPQLIERDYFCTVLLAYLEGATHGHLVFKGGTCLAKVLGRFYRLSEDLDFIIPLPVDASRQECRRQAAGVKDAVAKVASNLPCFSLRQRLRGANNSTQYLGAISYESLIATLAETITIEVSLREPLHEPVVNGLARTLLLDPVSGQPLVPEISLPCISAMECWAEKFRAALSRRDVAIRDFYDLDYAVTRLGLKTRDAALVGLVKQKLAVPGNERVDVGPHRLAVLRKQLDARLRSVLRQTDYEAFDLDRAFQTVIQMAESLNRVF